MAIAPEPRLGPTGAHAGSEWPILSTGTQGTRETIREGVRARGGAWQHLGGEHAQGPIGRHGGRLWIWGDRSVERRETREEWEWHALRERLGDEVRSQIGIQIVTGEGGRRLLPEVAEAL